MTAIAATMLRVSHRKGSNRHYKYKITGQEASALTTTAKKRPANIRELSDVDLENNHYENELLRQSFAMRFFSMCLLRSFFFFGRELKKSLMIANDAARKRWKFQNLNS